MFLIYLHIKGCGFGRLVSRHWERWGGNIMKDFGGIDKFGRKVRTTGILVGGGWNKCTGYWTGWC